MHDILLIEDSDDDAQLIKRTLKQARVTNPVVHIADGAAAERYIVSIEDAFATGAPPVPAVLFLDLKLPGFNGLDLLTKVQFRRALQRTLRVVLSGFDQIDLIKKAYATGAHSFLTKPVRLQDLEELIRTYPDYWWIR